MTACGAELCRYWTGQGCACDVMGLDPAVCQGCGGWHDPDTACDMAEPDEERVEWSAVTVDTRGRT